MSYSRFEFSCEMWVSYFGSLCTNGCADRQAAHFLLTLSLQHFFATPLSIIARQGTMAAPALTIRSPLARAQHAVPAARVSAPRLASFVGRPALPLRKVGRCHSD